MSYATEAEIQSGHDRQKWAEDLILQLPKKHDGRCSWLMSFGRGGRLNTWKIVDIHRTTI